LSTAKTTLALLGPVVECKLEGKDVRSSLVDYTMDQWLDRYSEMYTTVVDTQ